MASVSLTSQHGCGASGLAKGVWLSLGFSDVANEVCLQFLAKVMWPGCLVSRKRGVGLCLAKWVCPVCLVEIGVWPSKRLPHT